MTRVDRARSRACGVLLTALLGVNIAHAQGSSVLAAESKFADGVRLMKEDRCEQALPNFRASQELDPASGTLLDIGYCEARLGKSASAWLAYRQALALAQTSSRAQHERIARDEIAKLEPDLPYLTLVIPREVGEGISVELDGSALSKVLWSVSMPVDPGSHEVHVLKQGRIKWRHTVSVAAREHASVDVPASAFTPSAPANPAGTGDGEAAPIKKPPVAEHPPKPPAGDEQPHPAQRSTGATAATIVLAGVGLAGMGVGGALLASARHDYDSVGAACPQNQCTSTSAYDTRKNAIDRFHVSLAVAGGGVALLGAAAIVWFVSSPSSAESARSSGLAVGSERSLLGVTWRGRF